ncbi:hypothetical protein EYZ11_005320 [Aspergillus tanneri]|uniref:Uncharacterized protein n=1 Tax=Aspergillus tanneri TaxID=1220188 RepID=A0A4V3UPH7_9EURO|nr:hypothetical protein EYZ11_005320 [Aspergillus tanneri]
MYAVVGAGIHSDCARKLEAISREMIL